MPPAPTSHNIYCFFGTDEIRVKEAALRCVEEQTPPESGEFGAEIIHGVAESSESAVKLLAQTMQALQTLPFFGDKKVVWLKNVNFLADSVTGRAQATLEALEMLADLLKQDLPEGVAFVINASELDKRRSFYKTMNKIARVEAHDLIDLSKRGGERELLQFVTQRAQEKGLRFDEEAREFFLLLAGENTRQIDNELEKLDLFLGERREIHVEDVRRLVSASRSGVIFEIGDALGKKRISSCVQLIDEMLSRGESAIGILLAAIIPKVKNLLLARDLLERFPLQGGNYRQFQSALDRLSPEEIDHLPKKKDGTVNAYPLFLAMSEARSFTLKQLKKCLEECLKANRFFVSSQRDPKVVLHQLVIQFQT